MSQAKMFTNIRADNLYQSSPISLVTWRLFLCVRACVCVSVVVFLFHFDHAVWWSDFRFYDKFENLMPRCISTIYRYILVDLFVNSKRNKTPRIKCSLSLTLSPIPRVCLCFDYFYFILFLLFVCSAWKHCQMYQLDWIKLIIKLGFKTLQSLLCIVTNESKIHLERPNKISTAVSQSR